MYLKTHCGMDDAEAKHNADKYNEGRHTYDKFSVIVDNCMRRTNADIRDLTPNELSLDVNFSCVLRRSAKIKRKETANGIPVTVDEQSVQKSVDDIINSQCYTEARGDTGLVATIMNRIRERMVGNSIYSSQRQRR